MCLLSVPSDIDTPCPVTPIRSSCKLRPKGPHMVLWCLIRVARSSGVSFLSPYPRNSISTLLGPKGVTLSERYALPVSYTHLRAHET